MSPFLDTARREIRRMASRKMYLGAMVAVPVLMLWFFTSLLSPGLPLKVPVAVVDLDHSAMSRQVTRSLDATELLNVTDRCESYRDAMAEVRKGKIYGFIVIPANFERDAVAGRTPTLTFFNNLTYFVPGTLTFKGFKTVAVTTAGGMLATRLEATGAPAETASAMIQPVTVQDHPVGNPWMSYAIYLTPTFMITLLGLMIYLVTVFAITMEIKTGSSTRWLAGARGSIGVAVAGKLAPHFVVWSAVGQLSLAVMFGYLHYPCGHPGWLAVAMELFILAAMSWGLFVASALPNPRMGLICCALVGILSFSFAGISFPVQNMYGAIAIFSYLVPVRYLMLIYFTVGLNAFPVFFARWYFVALAAFPLVGVVLLPRLRRACLKPVYVP